MPVGGVDKEIQTVEDLTGIRFDYYALTAFRGFTEAVDQIGGLTIDLPYSVQGDGGGSWSAGVQHMSGADALGYARSRDHLPRGDFDRSWDQGFVMLSALDQFRAQMAKDPAARPEDIEDWVAPLAAAAQRRLLREVFARWDGHEVDTQGDAFFVSFSRAT